MILCKFLCNTGITEVFFYNQKEKKKTSSRILMFTVEVYEQHLKGAWCCARNGFPQHCSLSGTRRCSCSSPTTSYLLHHLMPVTLADGGYAFHSWIALFLSPWHHLTGWMRNACCSGGDLRVTRAASPRSAWVKRTEQVREERGGHLSSYHQVVG